MSAAQWREPSSAVRRPGSRLSDLGLAVATASLAVSPWFLGGAIPQGDLVLQLGGIVGSILVLAGTIAGRTPRLQMPWTATPVLAYCLIGVLQLLPIYTPPVLQMHHAVNSQLSGELPSAKVDLSTEAGRVRSLMPSETRDAISQLISLSLVVLVVFNSAATRRQVVFVMGAIVFSGCAMTSLALSQQFGVTETIIGNQWKVGLNPPFGCFVNANNAAGWLLVCLAASLSLTGIAFRVRRTSGIRPSPRWDSLKDRVWFAWNTFMGRLAETTTIQLVAVASVVLLIVGIASTLSRAGIVAAAMGLLAFTVSRLASGRWLGAILSLGLLLVLSCFFLVLIDLDTVILSELRTLRDPVSETTGRLLHWSDSLASAWDFPLLGTGLGAYRFASLPYQRHYTGLWFQRADNQYVEVLVEAGVAGLACIGSFGLILLSLIRRTLFVRDPSEWQDRASASWLGNAGVFISVAVAGAAFFDYGVSLPPMAGAILVITALLERQVNSAGKRQAVSTPALVIDRRSSHWLLLGVWSCLVVSSVLMISETMAACRVCNASVPAERQINRPDAAVLMESGEQILRSLQMALEARSGDLQAQRISLLFRELMVQSELTERLNADRNLSPQQLQATFGQLDLLQLADRFLSGGVPSQVRDEARLEISVCLRKYSFKADCIRLLRSSPCVLTVGPRLAASQLIEGDYEAVEAAVLYSRFAEPHASRNLYALGRCMLHLGRIEECRILFAQSVSASELLRLRIIEEISGSQGVDVAMKWFAPESYESSVRCALDSKQNPELRGRLFDSAEKLWAEVPQRLTDSILSVRALHLEATGRSAEALAFLQDALASDPKNVKVRIDRARMLERLGKNEEAYDEWLRLQSFGVSNSESDAALERLIRLPSVSR